MTKAYPQALHTYRINLSPFTKDFRVWGAPIETILFIYGLPSGNLLNNTNMSFTFSVLIPEIRTRACHSLQTILSDFC